MSYKVDLEILQAEFAVIFEAMDDGLLVIDMSGNILMANNAGALTLGFKNADEIKRNFDFLTKLFELYELDGTKIPVSNWPIAQILKGNTISNWELKASRLDLKMEWCFSVSGRPVLDKQGKQILGLVITKDVSSRKQAESRLQQLADSNIVGIVYWKLDGSITYANQVLLDIFGFTSDDIQQGRVNWTNLSPPDFLDMDKQMIAELSQTGKILPRERQYFQNDGSRVDVLIGGVQLDGDKEMSMSFVLDISERKRLEKLKDEFLSIASHELKTPVTSIKAYSQYLKKMMPIDGHVQYVPILNRMIQQSNRLTTLINELLDVSRIEAGKMRLHQDEVNFDDLVDEIVDDMRLTIKSHTINVKGKTHAVVHGDNIRIGQVITNLMVNAIKYSPGAEKIQVTRELIDGQVKLSVSDFGYGIPADQQEKIFERFYRAQGNGLETIPGIGLGLYISAEIIQRHKGTIGVKSTVGEGSTFYFTLPVVNSP